MSIKRKIQNKNLNKQLCKRCHKNIRVTLYFCQPCREYHNFQTRETKRRNKEKKACVDCGKPRDREIGMCSKCLERHNLTANSGRNNEIFKSGHANKLNVLTKII